MPSLRRAPLPKLHRRMTPTGADIQPPTQPVARVQRSAEDLKALVDGAGDVAAADFGARFQTSVQSLFEAAHEVDEATFGELAEKAGLNPHEALVLRAVLLATRETEEVVGRQVHEIFGERPALRNALHRHLRTVIEADGDPAVVSSVVSRMANIFPWVLAEPSRHPDVRARLEEVAEVFERANRAGSKLDDDQIEEIGQTLLELLPVSGEILSARDAYVAYSAALTALRDGNTAEALLQAANGVVSTIGAVPGVGTSVRVGKAVGKVGFVPVAIAAKAFGRKPRGSGCFTTTNILSERTSTVGRFPN